jgi:hypothetical protein
MTRGFRWGELVKISLKRPQALAALQNKKIENSETGQKNSRTDELG